MQQIELITENYDEVPFDAIIYLIGECNYGGKITDDRDRRCLNTILMDFCNRDVIENLTYSFSDVGPEYSMPKRYCYIYYKIYNTTLMLNLIKLKS